MYIYNIIYIILYSTVAQEIWDQLFRYTMDKYCVQ